MVRRSESRSRPVHYSSSRALESNNFDNNNNNKVQYNLQEESSKKISGEHQLESNRQQAESVIVQRRRQGRRPITFFHAILIVLLYPCLIASIQDALFNCSNIHDDTTTLSSRSTAYFGGVSAMAVPRSSTTTTSSSVFGRSAKENSQSVKRQQSIFAIDERESGKGLVELSGSNGSTSNVNKQHKQSKQSLKKSSSKSTVEVTVVKNELVPGPRWGHTAAFLPQSNVVLFVGGQVPSGNDSVVTNDVFAMDLNANSTQQWVQLSSKNLAPHAYAARAVTHNQDQTDEKLFIVGGSTADCSPNASSIFMWKAGKGWKDGQWSIPTLSENMVVPPRRRGARAMQVPVQMGLDEDQSRQAIKAGGSSFMLMGGVQDETTCSDSDSFYPNVDVWTMGAGAPTGRGARFSTLGSTMNSRTLTLDQHMTNMSMVDYSTVLLPANETQGDRILLLGGTDSQGNFTPFNQLWVLDLTTSIWSKMDTTNSTMTGTDIPLGRIGHTATRTNNGTIIVHGGYVSLDKTRVPTSDVHVLDYTVAPAVWSKVESSQDSPAPSRAFHTALMVADVMVIGFGEGQYDVSSSSADVAIQSNQAKSAASQPVHFLDTANPDGWTWSSSVQAVVNARTQASATSSSSSTPVASAAAASSSSNAKDGDNNVSEAPSASPAAITAPDATPSSSSSTNNNEGVTPKQRNTAVIASVLGAAAIAASLGGLYAAHKRREARANGDDDSMSGDKYERFSMTGTRGPPVSSLWLNQPIAWANNAGKGIKRRASLASEAFLNRGRSTRRSGQREMMNNGFSPFSAGASTGSPFTVLSNYSTPIQGAAGFQVLRNLPATSRLSIRRNQIAQQEAVRQKLQNQEEEKENGDLPDDFLHSILDDEEVRSRNDLRRTVGSGGVTVPVRAATITRAPSSESLGSVGGASHFSYPYLNAMHRPSLAETSPTGTSPFSLALGAISSPEGNFMSPRYLLQTQKYSAARYNNAAMTPSWTPIEAQIQDRQSFDDEDNESEMGEMAETRVAQRDPKSPSAMIAAAACISSPLFPWDPQTSWGSPVFPSRAALDSRKQTQRRARQSILRVTNTDLC